MNSVNSYIVHYGCYFLVLLLQEYNTTMSKSH
jgi:hypothetical protein